MLSLLKSNFYRMFKEPKLLIFASIIFGFSIFIVLFSVPAAKLTGSEINNMLFINFCSLVTISQNNGILFAISCSIFIGIDFSQNTIRNKVTIGKKRVYIYLSYYITLTVYTILLYLVSMIPIFTLQPLMLGVGEAVFADYLRVFVISLLIIISISAFFTFISIISRGLTLGIILNITIPAFLTIVIVSLLSTNSFLYDIGEFLIKTTPFGQSTALAINNDTTYILWALASTIVFSTLFTSIGCLIFRKIDLNLNFHRKL